MNPHPKIRGVETLKSLSYSQFCENESREHEYVWLYQRVFYYSLELFSELDVELDFGKHLFNNTKDKSLPKFNCE